MVRQAKRILVVPELPKTRSGKIMRRLLRDIAENRQTGDVTALQDTTVMTLISTGSPKPNPTIDRPPTGPSANAQSGNPDPRRE